MVEFGDRPREYREPGDSPVPGELYEGSAGYDAVAPVDSDDEGDLNDDPQEGTIVVSDDGQRAVIETLAPGPMHNMDSPRPVTTPAQVEEINAHLNRVWDGRGFRLDGQEKYYPSCKTKAMSVSSTDTGEHAGDILRIEPGGWYVGSSYGDSLDAGDEGISGYNSRLYFKALSGRGTIETTHEQADVLDSTMPPTTFYSASGQLNFRVVNTDEEPLQVHVLNPMRLSAYTLDTY